MSAIISVEHLTKTYRLGAIGGATLQGDFARWWAKVRRRPDPSSKIGQEHHARRIGEQFWALDDINFEVKEGEILGIIGRNGAGKSTLLKILSQVTAPTTGQVTLKGRVASLLEVGTGFHPELTGRENVYLNGAILGMTKAEIRQRFDEIVAFSECETFIDTPVKRYSSGMYVRLAFAVAAHLEPEILILDEVLAVGDSQFQRKCLGKMGDVAKRGRTILFVSHTMPSVLALCTKGILLRDGRIERTGDIKEVVSAYQNDGLAERNRHLALADMARRGSGRCKFTSISLWYMKGDDVIPSPTTGCDVIVKTGVECFGDFPAANVAVVLFDSTGYRLVDVNTALQGEYLALSRGERATISFRLFDLRLKPGQYQVHLWIGRANFEEFDYVESAAVLDMGFDEMETRHAETFPGTYQCRFTHHIDSPHVPLDNA